MLSAEAVRTAGMLLSSDGTRVYIHTYTHTHIHTPRPAHGARRAGLALEARGAARARRALSFPRPSPERPRALSAFLKTQPALLLGTRLSRGLPALPSSPCPPVSPQRCSAPLPPARFGPDSQPQPRAGALCWRPAGCFPLISRTGRGRPHFLPSHTSLSLDLNPFPPPSLPPCPLPSFPSPRLLRKSYSLPCCGTGFAGVGSSPLRASVRAGSRAAGSDGSPGEAGRAAGQGEKPPPGAGLGVPTAARLPLRGGPGYAAGWRGGGGSRGGLSSAPPCPGAGSSSRGWRSPAEHRGGIELTEWAGEAARRVWGSGVRREGEPGTSPPAPARVGCPAGCNVCMLTEKSRRATWTPSEDFRIPRQMQLMS